MARNSGGMARLVEEWDWAATPLGPRSQWPTSLQTIVRLMLSSRFPMWMGWGPDLAFVYNDAYRRDTLGVKHPWALGRPAREVWSEIWGDIEPRIESVLTTGAATWDEGLLLFLERSGYREETYHTFSYSPLTDEDGHVAGMLCVVTEDTRRVFAEQRMRTLQGLATALVAAGSEAEVFGALEACLGRDLSALPFALAYAVAEDGHHAHLVAAAGAAEGNPVAPAIVALDDDDAVWPLHRGAGRGDMVVVEGLASRFGQLPVGVWEDPPQRAVVIPLTLPGYDRPTGFFVAGLNPYRSDDHGLVDFARYVAAKLATALATARANASERRRAETLAELDRAKTAFFSNVSHEFRTPLTLIQGPLEDALADEASHLPASRELFGVVHRNSLRLRKLVDAMLDFAQLEAGRMPITPEPVDLAALTADLASQFRSTVERGDLDLVVECPPLPWAVPVDRDMWEKIVLNLISNAFKFTFTGTISVGLSTAGDHAVLTVADTGVGIPEAELGRLFERFHRVPGVRSRSHEGAGIGLALVSELVRLHGGTVAVDSKEGAGTTFTVRVPVGERQPLPATPVWAPARAGAFVDEATRWHVQPGAGSGDGLAAGNGGPAGEAMPGRVVLVDDNADLRDYLARALGAHWAVDVYGDGAVALDAIRADPPQLVVADVMMPGLDGFGLVKALRAEPATGRVPVILLSARAGEEAAVEGLDAGADDYLVKPFSSRELLARVRSNLDQARLRDEATRRYARLAEAASATGRCRSLRGCLAIVADAAREAVGADRAVASLTGSDASGPAVSVVSRSGRYAKRRPDEGPPVGGARQRPLVERRPVRLTRAELAAHGPGPGPADDPRGWLAAPMLDSHRRPIGLVELSDKDGADFSADDEAILSQLASLAANRIETLRAWDREHRVAVTLQRSLLPASLPDVAGLQVAARYLPGSGEAAVGGDWYDALYLPDGRLALVVGDVVGHGVKAAATMGQLRNALRAFLLQGQGPAGALAETNRLVAALDDAYFSTAVVVAYDPPTGAISVANAGHPPPLLVSAGETAWLDQPHGLPLGALTGATYDEGQGCVAPGATLLLYSDGLVERRGQDLDTSLTDLAKRAAVPGEGAAGLVERLVATLEEEENLDDVVVLAATRQTELR